METIEKMKELAEKSTLTKEDKEKIIAQCNELGIEFNPTGRCVNCFRDAAIQCAIKMTEIEGTSVCGLKAGVDVLLNGRRLCAATITEEWKVELKETMPEWWMNTYFEPDED